MSVRRIGTGRIDISGFWIFTEVNFVASKQIKFTFGRRKYEELRDERNRRVSAAAERLAEGAVGAEVGDLVGAAA